MLGWMLPLDENAIEPLPFVKKFDVHKQGTRQNRKDLRF